MRCLRATLVALSLTLLGVVVGAQQAATGAQVLSDAAFTLEPADPNPFERETRIVFVLGEELFRAGSAPAVSIRIYNLLHQIVAVPTVRLREGEESRRRLDGIRMPAPGAYEAIWDGRDLQGQRVNEGPYFIQLLVDGRSQVRKVLVVR